MITFGTCSLPSSFAKGDRVTFLLGWDPKKHPQVEGIIVARYALLDDTWLVEYAQDGQVDRVAVESRKLKPAPPPVSRVLPFRRFP